MGTGNGVHLFTNNNHTAFLQDKIYGVSRYQVNGIFEDREGSLWLATSDGLHTAQPYSHLFTSLSHGRCKTK